MIAPNHALTGALIGLSVGSPWLAAPLALVSHFICDAIPHYDEAGSVEYRVTTSKRFVYEQLLIGAGLCFLLVMSLAITQPRHWMLAAVCAFIAASPDLLWLPRFITGRRTGVDPGPTNAFLRFHTRIQWKTGPKLIWLEAVWFLVFASLIAVRL